MNEGLTVAQFFELWPLFRDAALTGALAGALLGLLGVYVVLRRLVFLSAAVSQIAGLGIALAMYLGLHAPALGGPTVGATALTLLALVFILRGRPANRDALLGGVWLLGAAGTLAVAARIPHELTDIDTLLFGSAVAVVPADFTRVLVLTAVIGAIHLAGWRGFVAATLDPDGARVRRLPVRLLDITLYVTLALALSICTRVIGALPTFAFSVLPAIAALRLAPRVSLALVLTPVLGALCGFGGYLLAAVVDLPVGATQTLVGVALAGLATLVPRR